MPDPTDAVVRRLRDLARPPDPGPDADLLGRFLADRDETSFAELVRRHGPMVLSVCRRVLGHAYDAEDAFQATFLVLARRAGAIRPRSLLANWLYGVAYRTALHARRAAALRREREHTAAATRDTVAPAGGPEPDLREVIDRELAALPEAYRAAVVVCDLEGLSRRDAAARLGWTEGVVAGRLARARAVLARKLAGYGLAVPAGLFAVVPECVAAGLADSTARVCVLAAAGEAVVAAPVAALTQGVLKAMLVTKLKTATAAAMVGCAVLVTAAAGWQAGAAPQERPAKKAAETPKKPKGKDAERDRIAELERERDLLLKRVAQLEERLALMEQVRKNEMALADAARKAEANARRSAEAVAGFARDTLTPLPAPAAAPASTPLPSLTLPPPAVASTTPVRPANTAPASEPRPSTPAPTTPPLTPAGVVPSGPSPSPSSAAPTPGTRPPAVNTTPLPSPGVSPEPQPNPRPAPRVVTQVYAVGELAADEKQAEALMRVVRRAVEPASWSELGGQGVVEFFEQGKALVVRNTPDAHKELGELLGLLRDAAGKKTTPPSRTTNGRP